MRSGVTLNLDTGSTLLGSPHVADYRRGNWPALILAKDQERVSITGDGLSMVKASSSLVIRCASTKQVDT